MIIDHQKNGMFYPVDISRSDKMEDDGKLK